MTSKSMSKITLSVSYLLSDQVRELLNELAIPLVFWQYARHGVLNFKTFSAKILGNPSLVNERLEVFTIYLPPALEQSFYQQVIHGLDLISPGRGSIYSQHVDVHTSMDLYYHPIKFEDNSIERFLSTKTHGISMIIGRGDADRISYSLLKNGYLAPKISFAEGMGIRNKMGLVRVTIPQQKEILDLTTYYQDASVVLDLLKAAGRLDLPGKGLVYHYGINFAKIDTKTQLSPDFDMATKEQMISAIDILMTNIDWRRKTVTNRHTKSKTPQYNELLCVTVYTPYKVGEKVIESALKAGVGGATMTLQHTLKHIEGRMTAEKDYDTCIMIMPNHMLEPVLREMKNDPNLHDIWIDSYPIGIG